jgi:CPA2 family monovalent cation:H+ antiporter-2
VGDNRQIPFPDRTPAVHVSPLLTELLLLVAIAAAGVALFERLRLPAIAGFLVMGALVGPGGLGWVSDPDRVRELAELGVVFLLFEIGLELPMDRLRRVWRSALLAGGLQVAVTLSGVALASLALGLALPSALVVGALVAMSSTALVLRLLGERGEVDAPQGQIALGILLVQDLCIVPFLLAVPVLAGGEGRGFAAAGLAFVRAAVALALFAFLMRVLVPRLLDRAAALRSRDLFTLLSILVVLGSAVAAEALGLPLAVGAFIAGLVTSASPWSHQLFAEILPLRGVLLGIFFTAVGMLLDPAVAWQSAPQVLGWVAGVVLFKALVVVLVVALVLREGARIGVLSGLILAQTGEFSFVLAAEAEQAGLLGAAARDVFVAGSVATLLATPFLTRAAPRIAALVARGAELPRRAGVEAVRGEALEGHAVLVGFGVSGRTLARVLRALHVPYVVLDANARSVADARRRGEPAVYGDATRPALLARVGTPRARLVAVATSDPIATREIVARARELAPQARVLARTRYLTEVDELSRLGANVVVVEEVEATLDMLREVLRLLGVPEGAALRFTDVLREEGYEPMRAPPSMVLDPWLAELLEQVSTEWVEVPDALRGEPSLADLALRKRTGASVLVVERDGTTIPNPEPGFGLRAGDRLLVVGSADACRRLREVLAERA